MRGISARYREVTLLTPSKDLFGGREGSPGSTSNESAPRNAAGPCGGRCHERGNRIADTATWCASSRSRRAQDPAANRVISTREPYGNAANGTVSARSAASAWAFRLRTTITHRVCRSRAELLVLDEAATTIPEAASGRVRGAADLSTRQPSCLSRADRTCAADGAAILGVRQLAVARFLPAGS
jgi:hypothetical protein